MTEFQDVEVIKACDPKTGKEVEAVVVPDGFYLCLITPGMAEAHAEWRECAAVRIVTSDDGTVAALEISDDLDWLTGPGGAS